MKKLEINTPLDPKLLKLVYGRQVTQWPGHIYEVEQDAPEGTQTDEVELASEEWPRNNGPLTKFDWNEPKRILPAEKVKCSVCKTMGWNEEEVHRKPILEREALDS